MSKEQKVVMSAYRQIAIDIAKNIAARKYSPGDRLLGRSVLASHYKVSPETIRKAMYLLNDVGIVVTEKGSGTEIVSVEKAEQFVKRYDSVENLTSVKQELEAWAKRQATDAAEVLRKIQYILNETERITAVSPLNPFQILITSACTVIGMSVNELQFWHNTGGTIVAIRRNDTLILSPGPYATVNEGDCFFIVGDDAAYASAMKLLFS